MEQDADVEMISGSAQHIGKSHVTTTLHLADRELEADQIAVDGKYFATLGLEVIEGRGFHDFSGSDKRAAVVNENLVQSMGWKHPIGETFRIDTLEYQVLVFGSSYHFPWVHSRK